MVRLLLAANAGAQCHPYYLAFNPTMVRLLLSAEEYAELIKREMDFQSRNGAIAACPPCRTTEECGPFNPTMVRLLRIFAEERCVY